MWNVDSTGFIVYRINSDWIAVKDTNNTTATGYGLDRVYNDVERIVFNDVTLDLTTMTFVLNGDGWGTAATLTGGAGNDVLQGTAARDIIYGGAGGDTLYGYRGNDDLYGSDNIQGAEGDDWLYGGSGGDYLSGGTGADTFVFKAGDTGIDTVTDFNASQGDALDFSDLLTGFDPLTDAITDFVWITESAGKSNVFVDRDGLGSAHSLVSVATLNSVTGLTDEAALLANGTIIAS